MELTGAIIYLFFAVLITAALGLIPASIAKGKGYSFGLWWLYGWALFVIALIHVSLIRDKNAPSTTLAQPSLADELKNYKELLDAGVLTQDEFDAKKKQLLEL